MPPSRHFNSDDQKIHIPGLRPIKKCERLIISNERTLKGLLRLCLSSDARRLNDQTAEQQPMPFHRFLFGPVLQWALQATLWESASFLLGISASIRYPDYASLMPTGSIRNSDTAREKTATNNTVGHMRNLKASTQRAQRLQRMFLF
jgi:hypothetical protein